jgi:hypothetical protein
VIGTDRWRSEPLCVRKGVPHGQSERGGNVSPPYARPLRPEAVLLDRASIIKKSLSLSHCLSYAGARAPSGGVTRQGVVLTDLESLLDCQLNVSLQKPTNKIQICILRCWQKIKNLLGVQAKNHICIWRCYALTKIRISPRSPRVMRIWLSQNVVSNIPAP